MISLARRHGGCFVLLLVISAMQVSPLLAIPEGKNNILFILVDDLGFNDVSLHGSPDVKSPNIDKLALEGAQFWNAYATAGFCSPSRASILTGRNPSMFGYVFNPPHTPEDMTMGMPRDMTLIPKTLNTAGYDSYILGKWHLGFSYDKFPLRFGFKDFFGFLGGQFRYFQPTFFHRKYALLEYLYNRYTVPSSVSYLTNDLTNKAMEYITRSHNNDKPFFIYLSYNAPHGPFEFRPEDVDLTVAPERQKHVAMIKALDDDVGRLVQHLTELGILEETLVVFTNDNGGHTKGSNNYPLRKFKGSFFEGGIRVPFFTYWKGTIAPGQNITHPITLMDVYPTAQTIAQVTPENQNPDLDGKNLLPHITMVGAEGPEVEEAPHEHICFGSRNKGLVRKGDFKILMLDGQVSALYNLTEDIGESTDLKSTNPEKAAELRQIYTECDPIAIPRLFAEGRRLNPISLTLNRTEGRVVKDVDVAFQSDIIHSQGKSVTYIWEVFRPKLVHRADYSFIRVAAAKVTVGADKTNASIRFTKTGLFVVRVTVRDNRWSKWTDLQLQVHNA